MQKHLLFANSIFSDLQCLRLVSKEIQESKTSIIRLYLHPYKVTKNAAYCDAVLAEWLRYMCEDDHIIFIIFISLFHVINTNVYTHYQGQILEIARNVLVLPFQ